MGYSILVAFFTVGISMISHMSAFGVIDNKDMLLPACLSLFGIAVFTEFLIRFQKGPSRVVNLKSSIESAFCDALDNSRLNPNKKLE